MASLASLRGKLLVDELDAWKAGPAGGGVLPLPKGAGNCLDIELTVTFPGGAVPAEFGSIGLSVLGAPAAEGPDESGVQGSSAVTTAVAAAWNFSVAASEHGPAVHVTDGARGSVASWGVVSPNPGPNCNQIAFLDTPKLSGAIPTPPSVLGAFSAAFWG